MTIQTFIERAIEGGWRNDFKPDALMRMEDFVNHFVKNKEKILLDPLAWKAVGKVEGWTGQEDPKENEMVFRYWEAMHWKTKMHRMIDALAEGKTIEQYLETL